MITTSGVKPLRLTLLTTSLDVGGAEIQVVAMAKGFKERGMEVDVISMLPPVAYEDELSHCGIPFDTLRMKRGVANPVAIYRLARLLRSYSPDILHCHMVGANLLGRVSSLFARPRVVISTAHNINEGPRWRDWAYKYTDWMTDLTSNVCQVGVDRYIEIGAAGRNKMIHVPPGVGIPGLIDAGLKRNAFRDSFAQGKKWVWLAVGNLRLEKDYPNLLRAVAKMQDRSATRVLIIGSGPDEKPLLDLSQSLGLTDTVWFLGARRDVPKFLSVADGFVMSSSLEGLPAALIEASFARLPIVATNVGGNSEVVTQGKSGYLIPPNSPTALCSAMEALMRISDEERKQMGETGHRSAVEKYSMTAVLDRWIEIYSDLYAKKTPGRTRIKSIYQESVQR